MSVDEYINKQINGKESLGSGDFDCSLLCAGSQSPYLPAPATRTQLLEKQSCPGAHLFHPLEGETCTGLDRWEKL